MDMGKYSQPSQQQSHISVIEFQITSELTLFNSLFRVET